MDSEGRLRKPLTPILGSCVHHFRLATGAGHARRPCRSPSEAFSSPKHDRSLSEWYSYSCLLSRVTLERIGFLLAQLTFLVER